MTDEDDAPLTDARADVTSAAVEYRPGEIAFSLNVAQPSDPRTDANWADGSSFALWALDTNADQEADFLVSLVNADGVLATVVLNPDMEPVCFGSGTFDGAYGAVIPSSCVGNPASFGWGAGIFYKMANGTVAVDGAPDGDNLAGPIAAPLPLDPTAGGYWLAGDDGGIFSFNAPVPRFDGRHQAQQADRGHGRRPRRARATGSWPPTAASSPSATPSSSAPPAP